MEDLLSLIFYALLVSSISYLIIRFVRYGFLLMCLCIICVTGIGYYGLQLSSFLKMLLYITTPYLFLNVLLYVFVAKDGTFDNKNK